MEELIEFTLLLKQLDDDELIQFLTTSMNGYGHNLFRKLFFNYFMNHRTNIKEHTQCLSDIINARKNKPNLCTDFTSYDRIDKLPSTLIAECASYLPLNEYFRFSQSNRQIFVSVNKPFKLYELTHAALRKWPQTMNMRKFKAVKSIHIDIKHFNQHISIPNQSIWKDSSFDKVTLSNSWLNDTGTAAFFAKKAINLNKIAELRLCHFNLYSFKAFCKILSCLKNVKRLLLQQIHLDRGEVMQSELFNKDLIQKWFPNLTSFGINVSSTTVIELSRSIINSIGHQIESLQINDSAGASALETVTCNFSKLKELELSYPSQACLNAFSKVTALQSMSVISDEENILKSCIDFMVKKQKSIHRMRIYATSFKHLKCVFDRIQSALFDSYSEGVKRNALFIYLQSYIWSRDKPDMVPVVETFKLLNTLKNMDVNHFMVQIKFCVSSSAGVGILMKQYGSAFDKMKDKYLVTCYTTKIYDWYVFTVANKKCKINGTKWRSLF